jgi:ATP-dependent DNA helicase
MDDAKQKHRTQAIAAAAEEGPGGEGEDARVLTFRQPALVTGAKMKDYQLEGVEWMMGLHQNGISGILGGWCVYSHFIGN